jgi:hypothetical protein
MAGTGGGVLLILPESIGGGVVDNRRLKEETQFNILVLIRRGPAEYTLNYC